MMMMMMLMTRGPGVRRQHADVDRHSGEAAGVGRLTASVATEIRVQICSTSFGAFADVTFPSCILVYSLLMKIQMQQINVL